METKCIGGREHGEFITADEPGFDRRFVGAFQIVAPSLLSHFGYCATCRTAMRWDIETQLIVDWPEVNLTPHCDYCHSAVPLGAHFISDVHMGLDTFTWPDMPRVVEIVTHPVVEMGQFCGPLCLIQFVISNERLRDVFAR